MKDLLRAAFHVLHIPMLNKRLFLIKRLKNIYTCLKKVAESICISKICYGVQLCARVRCNEDDVSQGDLKDLQKAQNKLLRFLNKTKISGKAQKLEISEGGRVLRSITSETLMKFESLNIGRDI